jgi:hypothetical protein
MHGICIYPLSSLEFCWRCCPPAYGPNLTTFPGALSGFAACPYCGVELEPPPAVAGDCGSCGERYYVRRIWNPEHPDAIDRRIVTLDGFHEALDGWAELVEEYLGPSIKISFVTEDPAPSIELNLIDAIRIRGRVWSQVRRREQQWLDAMSSS